MLDSITTLPHATQQQAEFNTMRYDEYSPLGEPDFPSGLKWGAPVPPHFISTNLGPYPGLLQNEQPPSKTPNYKMKTRVQGHQHRFATKCHAQGLYF